MGTIEYAQINGSLIVEDFDCLKVLFEMPVSLKLIFRASQHQFNVKEFHHFCDEYEDTLVLALTEDNKIIGGFTPLSWKD